MTVFFGGMSLVNTKPPSRKFYIVKLWREDSRWSVERRWGRLRSGPGDYANGRSEKLYFASKEDAVKFIAQLIKRRITHGYRLFRKPTLNLSV